MIAYKGIVSGFAAVETLPRWIALERDRFRRAGPALRSGRLGRKV
jgi:hypothetical protein